MKKVIGGAVCDTEKAELIGTNKAGISLYLTQNFVFFLSTFDRLTPDAAEKWAQTYLPTEIYKEKFDSFIYKFKKIRNLRGVTLKELAQLSGLSYQSLSGYQCGTIAPTLPAIQKIAKGLQCSVSELCEIDKHPFDVELEADLRHKTALNLVALSYNEDEYFKIKNYYQEKWNNGESFLGMNLLYDPAPEREGDTEEEIKACTDALHAELAAMITKHYMQSLPKERFEILYDLLKNSPFEGARFTICAGVSFNCCGLKENWEYYNKQKQQN